MKTYRVGILGGIGVGKSLVTNRLRALGANVLSADIENKNLFLNQEYLLSLSKLFPNAVKGEKVDTTQIRQIIFNDDKKKAALEALSHERIRASLLEKSKEGLWFIEIPLYIKDYLPFDEKWLIDSNIENRIQRIISRDCISSDLALTMINAQPVFPKEDCIIIENNGSCDEIINKIDALYYQTVKRWEE